MRILCLHGMGTSAQIFEAQTSRITNKLKAESHEFVFIDGLMHCRTTEDIRAVYPPEYLSYYNAPYPDDVKDAEDYIREVIDEEGPFDGVMGFSQGAALAAALMLEDQKISASKPPLFRFAIFICGSLPFNLDDNNGIARWNIARKTGGNLDNEFAGESDVENPPTFPGGIVGDICGRYHPSKTPDARLRIPVVHVVGKQDQFAAQSELLASMTAEDARTIIHHEGGHEMPRGIEVNETIVKAISDTIHRVKFPAT